MSGQVYLDSFLLLSTGSKGTQYAAASPAQPCLHKDNGDPWKTPNQQQNLEEIEGKEIKQEIPSLKIVGWAAGDS